MRRTQRNVLISSILVLMVLCGGSVYGYVRFIQNHQESGPEPVLRALTLDQVQNQTRLIFPAGTRLVFGEFYVLEDWAVAAHLTFAPKVLPEFLRANGLPKPKDGLRTVPAGVGRAPAPDTRPTGAQSPPDGGGSGAPSGSPAASPTGPAGTPGAVGSATASPAPPPTPAASIPSAPRDLLRDDAHWHPEAATSIAGIERVVHSSVARWVTFVLDDPETVTVYVYAVAEVPLSSQSPVPTTSGTPSKRP